MKKIILIITILLPVYLTRINKVNSEYITIPEEAIRLRIIGNSNNEYDQNIKMELSIEIEKEIEEILRNTKDINQARIIIQNNLKKLNNTVENFLKEKHYNKKYTIVYGNNFFPEKKYNDVIYKKGYYESLVITLGEGKGRNWWCVLFPPLCLMEAEESNMDNVEYKFFIKEIIDKYF